MSKNNDQRWKIDKSLDEGGQAHTYLVTDTTGEYEGVWVMKRLKNPNRIGRFRREIQAGLSLSHPNILQIIDHDLDAKKPYLVSEYCSGGPLSKMDISNHSIVDKLHLFEAICSAVGHAHSNRIVHRDIKPDNIFLREDGTPVVGDFGICYLDEGDERLTETQEAAGPRLYIAPELEDGRTDSISPKSDVYSLGKLLYWLVSGGQIFSREKHREPRYDLVARNADASIHFIYELLDKMIVNDYSLRLPDANVVEENIKTIIRRILMAAHPIDITAPQQCLYCGIGNYQIVQAEGDYADVHPQNAEGIGLGFSGDRHYFMFACDYCGNVQIFSVKHVQDRNVWKR